LRPLPLRGWYETGGREMAAFQEERESAALEEMYNVIAGGT